jgi:hypothetical protein
MLDAVRVLSTRTLDSIIHAAALVLEHGIAFEP